MDMDILWLFLKLSHIIQYLSPIFITETLEHGVDGVTSHKNGIFNSNREGKTRENIFAGTERYILPFHISSPTIFLPNFLIAPQYVVSRHATRTSKHFE